MKKHTRNKIFKIVAFGIIFMTGAITHSVISKKNLSKYNADYFESFNESFEGKITNVTNINNLHSCIIEIELVNSSTKFYDIRAKTNDLYYAIIKDKRAEIIEDIRYFEYPNRGYKIKKGLYFKFDGLTDTTYLYQNDSLIDKWKPRLNDFMIFVIRSKHKIK